MPSQPSDAWDAALYDEKHSFVWKHGTSLLALLEPKTGERILDLGCGTGQLTVQIAAAGAEVVGIDNSPAMIEQAQKAFPNLTFEAADAGAFAFAIPFDAVFSNAVLHWIKEPEKVIACIAQALKPGGRFVAELGGKGNVRCIAAALDEASQAMGCERPVNPWYFPGLAEYAVLLEQGGLEVTYASLFDRPTPLEGENGMRHWIAMFGNDFLQRIPPERREEFLVKVEQRLRSVLYQDGTWLADYRRLRVAAKRRLT